MNVIAEASRSPWMETGFPEAGALVEDLDVDIAIAGGGVHFNSFEHCWDCPCHGSQFGIDGAVLAGPALKPLARRQS